jgi:hypothetical protein
MNQRAQELHLGACAHYKTLAGEGARVCAGTVPEGARPRLRAGGGGGADERSLEVGDQVVRGLGCGPTTE